MGVHFGRGNCRRYIRCFHHRQHERSIDGGENLAIIEARIVRPVRCWTAKDGTLVDEERWPWGRDRARRRVRRSNAAAARCRVEREQRHRYTVSAMTVDVHKSVAGGISDAMTPT